RPIAIGLSKGSAIIEGTVAWYVDAQTGAVGRARLIASEPCDPGATARAGEVRGRSNQPAAKRDLSAAPAVIVEGRPVPHLTLFKATPPAGTGGAAIDIAQLRFLYGEASVDLYGEASVDLEDERQFARNPGQTRPMPRIHSLAPSRGWAHAPTSGAGPRTRAGQAPCTQESPTRAHSARRIVGTTSCRNQDGLGHPVY